MTPIKQSGNRHASDASAGSSPTDVNLAETKLNSLPLLTEVVTEAGTNLPRVMNDHEIQQLLRRLEARIEIMFTQKLGLHLEQLQRQAIDRALDEIKAELPALLRDAMDAYLDSR